MPTIVSSTVRSNIEAIKRYFRSEYACKMVAQHAGVGYDSMIAGQYKRLVEPSAYFTHNSQYYCCNKDLPLLRKWATVVRWQGLYVPKSMVFPW